MLVFLDEQGQGLFVAYQTTQPVEYTFRASASEMPTTILLTEYNLTVKQGKLEKVIPYAGINEVVLDKVSDKEYKTLLRTEGGRPLTITNKYYTGAKEIEDRSRAYSTFVRVLHFHLKDKSKAHYISGGASGTVGIWVALSIAAAFVIAFVARYYGLSVGGAYIDGAVLSVILIGAGYLIRMGRVPKAYAPTDIPLDFLP